MALRRTLTLLQSSTPMKRNTVRVLVYGQSITQQKWTQALADDLQKTYPNAHIVYENRAIGGFAANVLRRTAEHDLYPFYPDLVIFHDYGGDDDYEAIIRETRRRTTSEMLLINDHVATGQEEPKARAWHDQHSFVWMPALAKKYGVALADVRGPWRKYLDDNKLLPSALLNDVVHLNDPGCDFMATLLKPYLHQKAAKGKGGDDVKTLIVGKDVRWKNGVLEVPFTGNRVDVIAAAGGDAAEVTIDGKKPSEFPGVYTITRPSLTFDNIWPAMIRIDHNAPLLEEEWTAKITSITPSADGKDQTFAFTVTGSKTGADGDGVSTARFVSQSGRVIIEPGDWWIENSRKYSGKAMPVGFEIHWKVVPLFTDRYAAPAAVAPEIETSVTLAQGIENNSHTLRLVAEKGRSASLKAIRIYRPSFQ